MSDDNPHVRPALNLLLAAADRSETSPLVHLALLLVARYPTEGEQISWLSERSARLSNYSRAFLVNQGWGIPRMIEELASA